MDAESIVNYWLAEYAYTASTRNLEAHMALVSKNVMVVGLPNGKVVDYDGWYKRRYNEFTRKLLHNLTYKNMNVSESSPTQITFNVNEFMRSTQGEVIKVNKDITIHKKADQVWCVVMEHIHDIKMQLHMTPA